MPVTDEDAQPIGGVRFPDAEHPVGKPIPVSVAPVVTTSIGETCGNLGGWQQFREDELSEALWQRGELFEAICGSPLDKLIAAGYLLPEDREEMLKTAAALYERRPAH